ncbi:hypothetical protein [Rhodococcus koreensis]
MGNETIFRLAVAVAIAAGSALTTYCVIWLLADSADKAGKSDKSQHSPLGGERVAAQQSWRGVVDVMERGLQRVYRSSDDPHMVRKQVERSLRRVGIERISPQQGDFVDLSHDVVDELPAPSPELEGMVAELVRDGWRPSDRMADIIRYSSRYCAGSTGVRQ